MRPRRMLLAALCALAAAVPAAAQSSADPLGRGIRAYQALDFDAADVLFTLTLADRAAHPLSPEDRSRALFYLGATQVFRGRQDSAATVFRSLVREDPRYRPSDLVFPPAVTGLFDEVLRTTPALAVAVPHQAEVRQAGPGSGGELRAWVVTTVPQQVSVVVVSSDGATPALTLYAGMVADSVPVRWDGAIRPGSPPVVGGYVLVASAADPRAAGVRVEVPLEVEREVVDTLPYPPRPFVPRPAREALPPQPGPGLRPLAVGLLAGAAAVALPALVAPQARPSTARFAIGGALGLSGLLALLAPRHTGPAYDLDADSAAAGAAAGARAAWRASADSVHALNVRRRAAAPFLIRVADPAVRGGEP